MKVFIVIPNWNGADLIAEALTSLEKQTIKAEIVVVDNGSIDESVNIIEKDFPKVTLLKLPQNTGFAGGVNHGIKYALEQNADAVALFNNDAVATPGWLDVLAKSLEQNEQAGIVTGKLMRNDKKHLDSTGDFYSIWGMPFPRGRNQKDTGQFEEAQEVFAASGGASLYRAKMLKEIGLFDETFFAYYEDVDISFRAQLAGWKILYEPRAIVYHHVSATSSKLGSFTRYHATKNFFMLYDKNMPGWLYYKYLPLFLIQAARLAVSSTLRGGGFAYLKGLLFAIFNSPKTMKSRNKIQRNRKVSISYIDQQLYKRRPPRIPTIS